VHDASGASRAAAGMASEPAREAAPAA